MAAHDARSTVERRSPPVTTLQDFDVDRSVACEHAPVLYPRDRFVRCTGCGVSVPYSVNADGPIRRALEELSTVSCTQFELPDVHVGEHRLTATAEVPGYGRYVVCESCGRTALLDDEAAVLTELAEIPCLDGLSYVELVELIFSPGSFTPSLAEFGISNWYGRGGRWHDGDVRRLFRHERFQHTIFVCGNDDGTYTATLNAAPDVSRESLAELHLPGDRPADSATRAAVVTLVTFLSATDPMSAGDLRSLKAVYDDAREKHHRARLTAAYRAARETFCERFDDTPESFADAFAGVVDDEEVLRRAVGSGGFEDPGEAAFIEEILGHALEFPGFIQFVADRHAWSPPLSEP